MRRTEMPAIDVQVAVGHCSAETRHRSIERRQLGDLGLRSGDETRCGDETYQQRGRCDQLRLDGWKNSHLQTPVKRKAVTVGDERLIVPVRGLRCQRCCARRLSLRRRVWTAN